jgi:hypothetical protein
MLSAFLRWLRREPIIIERPYHCLLVAMAEKDPALRSEVGPMSVKAGIARWREVYPEDFRDGKLITPKRAH